MGSMIINGEAPPGKEWVIEENHYVCPYHRENPFKPNFPGCNCASSYERKLVDKVSGSLTGKTRN